MLVDPAYFPIYQLSSIRVSRRVTFKRFSIRTMYLRSLSWIDGHEYGIEWSGAVCRALLIFNAIQFLAFSIGKVHGNTCLSGHGGRLNFLSASGGRRSAVLFVDARGSVVSCSIVRTRYCQKPLVESELPRYSHGFE